MPCRERRLARSREIARVREKSETIPCGERRTSKGSYLGRAPPHGGRHPCISSCRICCPTNDTSPCRNARRNDRSSGASSSCPPATNQRNFAEVAAGRAEEGNRGFSSDDGFHRKSIRQCERILALRCRTADHAQWVETHMRQVFRSMCCHDALLSWSARAGGLL